MGRFAVRPDGGRHDVVLESGQCDRGGKCVTSAFCGDAVDGDGHADGGDARDTDLQAVRRLDARSGVEDGAVEWFENLQHDGSRGRKWLKIVQDLVRKQKYGLLYINKTKKQA